MGGHYTVHWVRLSAPEKEKKKWFPCWKMTAEFIRGLQRDDDIDAETIIWRTG